MLKNNLRTLEDATFDFFLTEFLTARASIICTDTLPRLIAHLEPKQLSKEQALVLAVLIFYDLKEGLYPPSEEDALLGGYHNLTRVISNATEQKLKFLQWYCPRMYSDPDLNIKTTEGGQKTCYGCFVLVEERNNFSRHFLNLRALGGTFQRIGWQLEILVLGGGTDHEAAYFPILDVAWDEEAKRVHDSIMEGQRQLISKQGVNLFPELQGTLFVNVRLYSEIQTDVEYTRERYSPDPEMEEKMYTRFTRVLKSEFGFEAPERELVTKIYSRYLERYSKEGEALDAEYADDYIFLETEEPKTITFWYKFERMPALHAYHRLEEGHHFNF